ncbi:DNA-directed RNA polymerase [Enterobacter phage 04_vB_Eclo_IJM]|nr:DNA-directed RNA polymerase [Enterobacter phage 04_vB_Eclo_IJM]
MQTLVPKLAQAVKEWHETQGSTRGKPQVAFLKLSTESKPRALLVQPESVAVIVLKIALSKLVKPEGVPITPMASAIGRTLEDEYASVASVTKSRSTLRRPSLRT